MSYIADTPSTWNPLTKEQKLEQLHERLMDDDEAYAQLRNYRGGCSCHISPPCSACSDPLTVEEAEDLGWLE